MSATVIIPTTGSPELKQAVDSVLNQTYDDVTCYVVIDGEENYDKVNSVLGYTHPKLKIASLPLNVGAKGFYGHRVYAAFTHLVNSKYVLYLDQDCWFDVNHVKTCIDTIEKNDLDWSYSLRAITNKDGMNIGLDNCESLGKWPVFSGDYHHIDTNCYCLKTEVAIKLSQIWHGGWGQDRVFLSAMSQYFPKFDCTGEYTVNYKVDGNPGSVNAEFFHNGNKVMNEKYNGVFPWRKI